MASAGPRPIALDADIVERFAARAKRLGTTQDKEISRALREWLATHESIAPDANLAAAEAAAESVVWHLVEEHGFLILEGDIPAAVIPDHRDLREQWIDDLVSLGAMPRA